MWSALVGKDLGDTPVRLLWGLLVALPVAPLLSHQPWAVGACAAICVAVWAGSTWGYGKTGMQMGRGGHSAAAPTASAWGRDAAQVLLHGAVGMALPALVAFWATGGIPWTILLAGVLCPLAYELAYRFPLHIPRLGCLNDPSRGLIDPCPTAELLWGGVVGLGTAMAFL